MPFGFEVDGDVHIAEEGVAANIASIHDHGWNVDQAEWLGGAASSRGPAKLTIHPPCETLQLGSWQAAETLRGPSMPSSFGADAPPCTTPERTLREA